jgi:hypothetical protein
VELRDITNSGAIDLTEARRVYNECTYETPKAVLIVHLHLQVRVKVSNALFTCFPHIRMLLDGKIAASSMMIAMIAICQAIPMHHHISLNEIAHHQQEQMAPSHHLASDSSSIGKQGKRL